MEPLGGLAALGALVLVLTSFVLLGLWVLGPLNTAGGSLRAPTRFLLTDFIWLMLQLQLVLALAVQNLAEAMPRGRFLLVLALICLPVVVLWAASVHVVSRAGIVQPARRATVILLSVPGTLAVMMATPCLVIGSIVLMGTVFSSPADRRGWALWQIALVFAGTAASPFVAYGLRRVSFWVLSPPAASSVQAPDRPV